MHIQQNMRNTLALFVFCTILICVCESSFLGGSISWMPKPGIVYAAIRLCCEQQCEKINLETCAPSEDSDEPLHQRSLITKSLIRFHDISIRFLQL